MCSKFKVAEECYFSEASEDVNHSGHEVVNGTEPWSCTNEVGIILKIHCYLVAVILCKSSEKMRSICVW